MAKHVINQLVHIQLGVHINITTTVKKRVNDIRIGMRECTRVHRPNNNYNRTD